MFKNNDILRNIAVRKKDYLLQKRRERVIIYSETFKSLAEAILVRDLLEKNDWSVDLI